MKIEVMDAFGTVVGHAIVEWEGPPEMADHLGKEARELFAGETTVTLPTPNIAMSWSLKVTGNG